MERGCLHVLELILLLEQGDRNDELMLRTELQKQALVVIALVNYVSASDSFPHFEVSSHTCI